jgi:hypothetical protein
MTGSPAGIPARPQAGSGSWEGRDGRGPDEGAPG